MKKTNIHIKDVDETAWLDFKAKCVRQKKKQGQCITEALKNWTKNKQ